LAVQQRLGILSQRNHKFTADNSYNSHFIGTHLGIGKTKIPPSQKQNKQPGKEFLMQSKPKSKARKYLADGKLKGKKAIITGGDSSRHDEKNLYMYKRGKWHIK